MKYPVYIYLVKICYIPLYLRFPELRSNNILHLIVLSNVESVPFLFIFKSNLFLISIPALRLCRGGE